MTKDPIIAEVREARHRISAQFGHEVRQLCEHYMEVEKKNRARGGGRYADLPEQSSELALHDRPTTTDTK